MNHPSLKDICRWVKWISMTHLAYSMILKNFCEIIVGKFLHWRSHPSLMTWRIFKGQCATLKVISCLLFFIETIWLSLMNGYMKHTWRIIRIFISSKFKMINIFRGCKILVLPPMFQLSYGGLLGGFSWHDVSWETWKIVGYWCVWRW